MPPGEVKIRGSSRKLCKWIVEQVNSGKYPGLVWEDEAKTMFRIPWKHAGRQDFSDGDTDFFKAWADFKGRPVQKSDWKTRMRCALNKSREFCEVFDRSLTGPFVSDPYKVYRLVPLSEQGLPKEKKKKEIQVVEEPKRKQKPKELLLPFPQDSVQILHIKEEPLTPPLCVEEVLPGKESTVEPQQPAQQINNMQTERLPSSGRKYSSPILSSWIVEQLNSGKYPGVVWIDEAKTMFRIPWKHGHKMDFCSDKDVAFFKAWAEYKGSTDLAGAKHRMRCALNNSIEFSEVCSRSDVPEPYKVYQLVPPSEQRKVLPQRVVKPAQHIINTPTGELSPETVTNKNVMPQMKLHGTTERFTVLPSGKKYSSPRMSSWIVEQAWAEHSKGNSDLAGNASKSQMRCALNQSREFSDVSGPSVVPEPYKVFRLVPLGEQGSSCNTPAHHQGSMDPLSTTRAIQDILHMAVRKEEESHRQDRTPSLLQEEPAEPPPLCIKEEPEEVPLRPEEPPDGSVWTSLTVKREGEEDEAAEEEEDEKDVSSHCAGVEVELHSDTEEVTGDGEVLRESSEDAVNDDDDDDDDDERRDGESGRLKKTQPIHGDDNAGEKALFCKLCNKSFLDPSKLEAHRQRVHNGEKKCTLCDKSFRCAWNLKMHQRVHTGEKPFRCTVCGQSFGLFGTLKVHRRTHTGEKPFLCEHCGKGFTITTALRDHQQRVHAKERTPFRCPHCGMRFGDSSALEDHRQLFHTREKPFKCQRCDERCADAAALRRHQQLFHNTTGKPFKCTRCDESYTDPSALEKHHHVHTGKETPFSCTRCGKSFSDSSGLRRHHQLAHTTEKPFKCTRCNKSYSDPSALDRHRRVHTGENPFRCTHCDKSFGELWSLKIHRRTVHKGGKPCDCKHCGKGFVLPVTLRKHERSVHGRGEELFLCERCGKRFSDATRLTKHQRRVHHTKTRFGCTRCNARFGDSSRLGKTSKCSHCDETYADSPAPDRDQRVHHTGETALLCEHCGVGFGDSDTLAKHQHVHSGEGTPVSCRRSVESRRQVEVITADSVKQEEVEDHPDLRTSCNAPADHQGSVDHLLTTRAIEDLLHKAVRKEQNSSEEERSSSLLQEELKPPRIKKEPEEVPLRPEEPDGPLLGVKTLVKSEEVKAEEGEDISSHCAGVDVELASDSDVTEDSDDWGEAGEDDDDYESAHLKKMRPIHGDAGQRTFFCKHCGKSFTNLGNLRQHRRRSHMEGKPFKCTRCDKSFHKTKTEEKPFCCPHCDKSFSLSTILKTPTGEGSFLCELCGEGFSDPSTLAEHQQRGHSGYDKKTPFSCTDRGLDFSDSSALGRHQLAHTGEKPFKRHQHVHAEGGGKPFRCTHSDKSFIQSSDLNRHKHVHTGDKSLNRKDCDRESGNEKDHRRLIRTGEKTFQSFGQANAWKRHPTIHSKDLQQEKPGGLPHVEDKQQQLLQRPEDTIGSALTKPAVESRVESEDDKDTSSSSSSRCFEIEVELESDTEVHEDGGDWEETSEVRSQSSQAQLFPCPES